VIALAGLATLGVAVALAVHDRTRRLLEQELERELAEERARLPEKRPALREPRAEGELYHALFRALDETRAPPAVSATVASILHERGEGLDYNEDIPATPPPFPEEARPVVDVFRRALYNENADVLEAFLEKPRNFGVVRLLLELAARDALSRSDDLAAAQLALDRWQLEHDIVRVSPSGYARRGRDSETHETLLLVAIPLLSAAELDEVEGELDRLEAGVPRCRDLFRRRRILAGITIRSLPRSSTSVELPGLGKHSGEPEAVWSKVNEVFAIAEDAASRSTRAGALHALEGRTGPRVEIARSLLREHDLECEDLARIRAVRIFLRVRRFELTHRRLPVTLAEALGREPDTREADPADGLPLELEVEPDRSLPTTEAIRVFSRYFSTGFKRPAK
jgi:hypothetical protein